MERSLEPIQEEILMTEDVLVPSAEDMKTAIEAIADKSCPKCYGRGYSGITLSGEPIICPCFKKNIAKQKRK